MKKFSYKTGSITILKKKLKIKNCRIPNFIFFSKKEYLANKEIIFKKND